MLTRIFKPVSHKPKIARCFGVEEDAKQILSMKCYYDILGVGRRASKMDVKKRYRDMTKVYHPDIWKNKNAHPVYQLILEAYGVLENKQARGRYDSFLDKKHNSGNKTKDFKSDYQNFETRR